MQWHRRIQQGTCVRNVSYTDQRVIKKTRDIGN